MLVDVISDTDHSTLREKLASSNELRQRVASIGELPSKKRDELVKEAFAWPEEKLFPIYTPEHALISSVYLEGNNNAPDFVKTACQESCAIYGIDVEISNLTKVASQEIALTPDDFAIPSRLKLPLVDKDSFRLSRHEFEKCANELSFEELVLGATQLEKKASIFGEESSDEIRTWTLKGSVPIAEAKSILDERYVETANPDYIKIAESLAGETLRSQEAVANFLFDVVSVDGESHIEKSASEAIAEFMTSPQYGETIVLYGEELDLEKVASIDAEDWTNVFSMDTVEALFQEGTLDTALLQDIEKNASEEEKQAIISFVVNTQ